MKTLFHKYQVRWHKVLLGVVGLLCFTAIASPAQAAVTKSKNVRPGVKTSFAKPDFAYPETVSRDATAMLANGSPVQKVQAAIQLTIAGNMVTPSDAGKRVAMLDSLAPTLPQPFRSLGSLLSASLLNSIYQSDTRKFNRRVLPPSDIPADPLEWSGEIFRQRIRELLEKSMADIDTLDNTDISVIAPLLDTEVSKCRDLYPSAGTFVAAQVIEISGSLAETSLSIPFNAGLADNPDSFAISIIDRELASLRARHLIEAEVQWTLLRSNYEQNRDEYLRHEYLNRFSDVPAGVRLLLESDMEGRYQLLRQAALKFKGTTYGEQAENMVCRLTAQSAAISGKQQYLSDTPVAVNITASNISNLYILLYSIPFTLDNTSSTTILDKGKFLGATPVQLSGTIPFTTSTETELVNPGYGNYAVLLSTRPDSKGLLRDPGYNDAMTFCVSDMQIISTSQDTGGKVYVVNAHDMAPIKGVKATLSNYNKKTSSLVSDADGCLDIPAGNWQMTLSNGRDILKTNSYSRYYDRTESKSMLKGSVLTDLSVYHPGDSTAFAAVLYESDGRTLKIAPQRNVTAFLRNANYQKRDSISLTSDSDGRITGKFPIPDSGLLGSWSIQLSDKDRTAASAHFQVADYKTPTFFVEIDDISSDGNDTLTVNGHAMTYSGMPLSGSPVDYNIQYISWWFWRGASSAASYSGKATTAADGSFTINLDTKGLKGTSYQRGGFSITASVTSGAGETQTSQPRRFAIGEAFRIDTSAIRPKTEVSGSEINFSIPVLDIVDKSVSRKVNYEIRSISGEILKGSFISPALTLSSRELPSGKYDFTLTLDGDTTHYTASTVIFRTDDRKSPYATPLWVPVTSITADHGSRQIAIKYATGYPGSHILCRISDCNGLIKEEWLKPGEEMQTLKVNAPADGNRVWVTLAAAHDLKFETRRITVLPSGEKDSVTIETETFRDRIVPGEKEHWRFNIRHNSRPATDIPVMAVMTDKALDHVVPFAWNFNPRATLYFNDPTSVSIPGIYDSFGNAVLSQCPTVRTPVINIPEWNFYHEALYSPYLHSPQLRMYKTAARGIAANSMVTADAGVEMAVMKEESLDEASALSPGAATDSGSAMPDVSGIPLNDNQHPLAFFRPMLSADSQGILHLEFTAPSFSTTWQLQIAAYSQDLSSDIRTFDIVAAKPVMVKANYPRFLRTGDKTSIAASLMNNTDTIQSIAGVIEIFDPATGSILKRQDYPAESLSAKSTRTICIPYDVTDSYCAIGVRCYAIGTDHRDGEQDIIGILPSSTPVIESTPFYLGPEQHGITIQLPEFDTTSNVTMQYCANPVWYCVTALPSISRPESDNIFARLDALFGNAVAEGLASRIPAIRKAIAYWTEALAQGTDSTLVSNLAKDNALKRVGLTDTPWVNNAASESLRMQSLTTLLDSAAAHRIIADITDALHKQQHPSGGWSWTEHMRPSAFVTSAVLLNFAWLKEMGCLPEIADLDKMTAAAVKYCDTLFYDNYIRNKKKTDVRTALDWLYIRSFYDVKAADSKISACLADALKTVIKDWRRLDIYGRATAVLLLASSEKATATAILESIRQNGVTTPSAGMYFDNIAAGWNGYGRLQTTAQALLAFHALTPEAPEINALRQWLIMQRQVEDWGQNSHTAAVVHAILTTGSGWLDESTQATITLGGRTLDTAADRYTGALTLTLDPTEASGKTLTVSKGGNQPAWGGVLAQYVRPIDDVRAVATDQLSITKQIVPVDAPDSDPASGQLVRVTLTLTNDRDLQYVAVTDDRGACLEPVDQISSYAETDGIWVYREIRDTATNLFIGFLPKGVHVISYDCRVDRTGTYTTGIATAQSLYAPLVTAHSAGNKLIVK